MSKVENGKPNFKQALWANGYLCKVQTKDNGVVKELIVDFRDGYPRFSISVETTTGHSKTTIPFTNIMLITFAKMIKRVTKGLSKSYRVTSRNNKFTDHRTDDIEVRGVSEVRITDTCIQLCFYKDNVEHIFPLTVDTIYFGVEKENSESIGLETNIILAEAYSDLLANLVHNYLAIMVDKKSKIS